MKKRIGNKSTFILALSTILMLFACDESANTQKLDENVLENIETKLDEVDTKRAVLVESIIRSSPTVAETGEIFAELGSDFNRDYLNDIKNTDKYTTLKAQGINLGVYLADLAYISTYEQSQEVIFYLNCAEKMATGIGVSDVFNQRTTERMEMNMNDKDSMLNMISELYWKTDEFLKELNRENISALIICGGWIEGMHIGSRLIEDGYDDDLLYEKIISQKGNLMKIITLLKTFEGDDDIDLFEVRLAEIESDYNKLSTKANQELSSDDKVILNDIAAKIETLRNEINKA